MKARSKSSTTSTPGPHQQAARRRVPRKRLRDHPVHWMLVSADEFGQFSSARRHLPTDIQRAARFFYLAEMQLRRRIVKPTYGISATGAPRLNLLRIEDGKPSGSGAGVLSKPSPTIQVIQRFDKPGTFFCIGPAAAGTARRTTARGCWQVDFGRLAAS